MEKGGGGWGLVGPPSKKEMSSHQTILVGHRGVERLEVHDKKGDG